MIHEISLSDAYIIDNNKFNFFLFAYVADLVFFTYIDMHMHKLLWFILRLDVAYTPHLKIKNKLLDLPFFFDFDLDGTERLEYEESSNEAPLFSETISSAGISCTELNEIVRLNLPFSSSLELRTNKFDLPSPLILIKNVFFVLFIYH